VLASQYPGGLKERELTATHPEQQRC